MKKWVIGIISGIMVTVLGGVILHKLLGSADKADQDGSETVNSVQIHFQELQEKKFQSEIFNDKNGNMRQTTVRGYLDLDDGRHNKNNCDLMIWTTFFDEKSGFSMRSYNSDIEVAFGGICPEMVQKPDGSVQMNLLFNREYCVKTNQGRSASIVFHRILSSWGKYAAINVRMTIRSYEAD